MPDLPVASCKKDEGTDPQPDDIAIVGMAGRFPGADSVDEWWQLLLDGGEGICDLQRPATATGSDDQRVYRSAILKDAYSFDAGCFGLSASEALVMDPQQRLLLQCAWHALEEAACDPYRYKGEVACYVGIGSSQYLLDRILKRPDIVASIGEKTVQLGNDPAFAATQLAYRLNLLGAALTVNSACSTSLTGVQLACAALRRDECQLALVGGSQLSRHHGLPYPVQSGGILSAQGRCCPFDASADGTISGSGCAVVALQTLQRAQADQRRILAVIKSVAVNNDGANKLGFTAPAIHGQVRAIQRCLDQAGVKPQDIGYHECHGTATALGDPVELAALAQVHDQAPRHQPCQLGALKANVGHMAAAAGVAGLMKATLTLARERIPPLAHFESLNPALAPWPRAFEIPQQAQAWPRSSPEASDEQNPQKGMVTSARYASVSAFGMGGTNAHAVLQEAPLDRRGEPNRANREWYLLPLSAATPSALALLCDKLVAYLEHSEPRHLLDVAHTLISGRRELAHRCVLVVAKKPGHDWQIFRSAPFHVDTATDAEFNAPQYAWLLPGQGSQSAGMGRSYYHNSETYQAAAEACFLILNEINEAELDFDPKLLLIDPPTPAAEQRLAYTDAAQLLLFIHGFAIARMWQHWGIDARAMVGHSLGEYVAACLADVVTLKQALRLILRRGRAMAQAPAGRLLAVLANVDQVLQQLQHLSQTQADLAVPSVALHNSSQQVMVAGEPEAIEALQTQLTQAGIASKLLGARHAFHTPAMAQAADQVAADWAQVLAEQSQQQLTKPLSRAIAANHSGQWMTAQQARDPEYWRQHTQDTVRFHDNICTLVQAGFDHLIDCSPSQGLAKLIPQMIDDQPLQIVHSASQDAVAEQGYAQALLSLGQLWCQGYAVDLSELYRRDDCRAISLPLYPFETTHYELQAEPENTNAVPSQAHHSEATLRGYTPRWVPCELAAPIAAKNADVYLLWGKANTLFDALQQQLHQSNIASHRLLDLAALDSNALLERLHEHLSRETAPSLRLLLWAEPTPAFNGTQLLAVSQALLRLPEAQRARIELLVVTTGGVSVAGETLHAHSAGVAAAITVLRQEGLPCCACVDVDTAHQHNALALLDAIPSDDGSCHWALRRGAWWRPDYVACHFDGAQNPHYPLQDQAGYWVTGANGGLGFVFCLWLLQQACAQGVKIQLVGLSRHAWTLEQQQQLAQASAGLQHYQHVAVDLTDSQRVKESLLPVLAQQGPVRGIIHSAGVAGGAFCLRQSAQQLNQVMGAKYQGLLNLQVVLSQQGAHVDPAADGLDSYTWPGVDFVLLCSSLNALKGGAGRWDYAQANAALDHYAQMAHGCDPRSPVRSVNWPAWLEQGMAARRAERQNLQQRGAISNEQALKLLPCLLKLREAQILVTQQGIATALSASDGIDEDSLNAEENRYGETAVHQARPDHLGAIQVAETELQQQLCNLWAPLLGLESVGIDDDFFALGGHSLLLVQLGSLVEQHLDYRVEANELFALLTVRDLAKHLEAADAAKIEQERNHTTQHQQGNDMASADDELAGMIDALEQMSPAAVDALLGSFTQDSLTGDSLTGPQGGVPGDEPGD